VTILPQGLLRAGSAAVSALRCRLLRAPLPGGLALAVAVAGMPLPAGAQTDPAALPSFAQLEAAGATIGAIHIVVDNIFDLQDPRENNALFRVANRLHIKTRPGVVRRGLLFRSGERVSVALIEETERLLRGSPYLYDVRIRPVAWRDGVVDIEVATRDTWTLYPVVSFSRSGGENRSEFSLREINLFGTGTELRIGTFNDVDRSGTQAQIAHSNAFGHWIALGLGVSNNSDGSRQVVSVQRPFYALDTRWSAGLRAIRDDRIEPVVNAGEVVSEYRRQEQIAEAFGGWSTGRVDGWVRRSSVGYRLQDNAYAPEPGRTAPANLPPDEKQVGPFVRFELVEDRYAKLLNRNQMGRPEYFPLGLSTRLQLGWTSSALGSTHDALVYSGTISRGFAPQADHTLLASAAIEGQYTGGKIRRQQFGARGEYFLPQRGRWLLYTSVAGDLLTRPDPSDFLYLGGDNGLRGYPLRYQAGTRRALLTVEERLYTAAFPFRLFRVGAAVYADVGRAWGGSNPNQRAPGWLVNAGFGLRIFAVRAAEANVAHLDVAFPVNAGADVKSVQFLVSGKARF
jgi:outer membrane protein assembly factor BamA